MEESRRAAVASSHINEEEKLIEAQLLNRRHGASHVGRLLSTHDDVHKGNILCVRFAPSSGDDILVATGSVDKTFRVTNLTTGAAVFQLTGVFKSAILCIEYHPVHPQLVLCACMDGSIYVIDSSLPAEYAVLFKSTHHKKYVVSVKWLPVSAQTNYDSSVRDGFAAASYDHSFTLWTASEHNEQNAPKNWSLFKEHLYPGTVEALECVSATELAVSVREDNYLHLISTSSGEEVGRLNMNTNGDDHVSFTIMHLSCSTSGQLWLATTDKHRSMLCLAGKSPARVIRNFFGATNNEFSNPRHCWSADERYVYATSQDNSIVCWEVATQRKVAQLMGHSAMVRDLHRHPTKNLLVSCGFDKTVRLWSE
jgi:COMPASS component SWD3